MGSLASQPHPHVHVNTLHAQNFECPGQEKRTKHYRKFMYFGFDFRFYSIFCMPHLSTILLFSEKEKLKYIRRIPLRKVRSKMGNSLEQYRATIGTHFIFLMSRRYQLCMTGKFWNTILMLFYMEAIYLPTLKVVVQNYNMMRFNRLWLTQIYHYQFYMPELIQLANDIEVNPGPEISTESVNLEDPNKKNYIFIEPWNAECQSFWCSALDLPLIVKHKNCSEMVKPLDKPSKLYRIVADGNCLFRALSYAR